MVEPSLERRLKILEDTVDNLQNLPQRITGLELQLLELGTEMRSEFSAIRRDMIVKSDLEQFAAKADLERFAAKADLERFATKADLERFATKADLERFAAKVDLERFATKVDLERFATKAELERFATKADLEQLRGELGATRVEVDALAHELSRFETVTLEEFGRVRQEIREGDEETRRFMRVLHEAVLERIAWLGEGLHGAKKAKRRKP
jgi:hypothetical protein